MNKRRETIFFAYQGRREGKADENLDAIKHALREYNSHQRTYKAESWEEYAQTGFISQSVLDAINNCTIFAADLTYFNHNVLFELGYAIAKNRKIVIFLNKKIENAASTYHNSFLKDIKYQELTNSGSILKALQQKVYNGDWIQKYVKLDTLTPKSKGIFYIESRQPNQSSLDLTDYLEMFVQDMSKSMVTENRSEVQYQPINWYFSNIYQAVIILIHFVGSNIEGSFSANAFNSFWSGIACGFGREVLLVAPAKYKAPLDYYEIMVQYQDNNHLVEEVDKWLNEKLNKITQEINKAKVVKEEKKKEQELNLLRLGIGCEIAENERDNLLDYFVPTSSYDKAKEARSVIIIGRKGSGKSAIYIKMMHEFSEERNIYVINLKPESDELLYNIDFSKMFDSLSSRLNFFFTVWKCIILSKLFLSIYSKIIKPKSIEVPLEEWEQEISEFYKAKEDYLNMNFFSIISKIAKEYMSSNTSVKPSALEYLYQYYIGPVKKILNTCINHIPNKKYCQIVILADNLDRTWNSDKNLDLQVDMISTLLEIESKIIHELPNLEFKLRSTLFLRKDIFEYICNNINEPDKLYSMTHEINWEEYPNKLKLLVENRFCHILGSDNTAQINNEVWDKYFDIGKKEKMSPYQLIETIISKRPRDLIYFISKLFESAVNNGHEKVNEEDLNFAIDNYTIFLNKNLIAEVRAIFPEIPDILAKLQQYHGQKIEYVTFCRIVKEFNYDKHKTESLVEELFNKGYMLGYDEKTQTPFSDIEKLKAKLQEKRWFFFKNKVYVIAHAKYYFIKNKRLSSF
jgi:nucleoside 2-deoxyribosyltransferase